MADEGPERADLEETVDDIEERVLGGVEHQDRHDEDDEDSAKPAIEQNLEDDELGTEEAGAESSD